jgi:hypothetical protein
MLLSRARREQLTGEDLRAGINRKGTESLAYLEISEENQITELYTG